MSITTVKPSKTELQSHADKAEAHLEALHQGMTSLAKANQHLIDAEVTKYQFTGELTVAAVVVWSKVTLSLDFEDGIDLNFSGTSWGPGFGGGVGWGSGYFTIPPSELKGKEVKYQITFTPVASQMSFWLDGSPIGAFGAGGIGPMIGEMGGSGTFS